jgi:hypothetical protein
MEMGKLLDKKECLLRRCEIPGSRWAVKVEVWVSNAPGSDKEDKVSRW